VTWAWPSRRRRHGITADDYDQMPRLAAFRAAHPSAEIGVGEFGTWDAVIPLGDGERYAARPTLRELLDRLGELYGER
jgi:hypothetical protein